MIKITARICFILCLLLFAGLVSEGQGNEPAAATENVVLFTDRTLYIAGEQILFSAFLKSENDADTADVSRILYCELITPDGNQLCGNKYPLKGSSSSGYIDIPDNIITGIYYLRAYTRYMRNYGPGSYHYTRLKIVNPESKDVRTVTKNNNFPQIVTVEEGNNMAADSTGVSADKAVYTPGDTVRLTIDATLSGKSSYKLLSVAVVPEFSVPAHNEASDSSRRYKNSGLYYRETRGPSVTGRLIDKNSGKALPAARINLSLFGKGRDFMASVTDSSGRFFFSLPGYTGARDIFLSADNIHGADPEILADNDFCTIPIHIPAGTFVLTPMERQAALKMAINVQLGSYFKSAQIPDSMKEPDDDPPFYGKPNVSLDIDKYIRLPALEDYFNELPTLVSVRNIKGEKVLKVLGDQAGMSVFNPLILVDLVAVNDPALILKIPPSEVSRIEVVNLLYLKGDQVYGGIINIISRKGDFAGTDLPSSGIFLNYRLLAENNDYPQIHQQQPHKPDTRNTLFWNPHLLMNNNHKVTETFTLSGTPGNYLIVVKALTSTGEVKEYVSRFEVVKQAF